VNIKLHVVGDGPEVPHLKKLSDNLKINDHIIFHGFNTGKDLDQIFNQCHIAIGSLAPQRKGYTMDSALKSREYCARGIPYIIVISDADFPNDFPYSLRLPADESPIDMDQVITFTSSVYQDPDHPQKMRQYASENLDWSVKMKKLKVFLEDLVKKDCSNREDCEFKNNVF
jgi:hypothetical protein